MPKKKGFYSIGTVASICKIHPQTLRLYEREGLVTPLRTGGNTRVYTDAHIKKIETIQTLTHELGVNLAGVEIIIRMREQMEEMQKEMDEMVKNVMTQFGEEFKKWRNSQTSALVKLERGDVTRIKRDKE